MDKPYQGIVPAETPSLRTEAKTLRNPAWLFCALTFGFSWAVWIFVSRVDASSAETVHPFLTTEISVRGILLILGNLVPGIVAIVLSLLLKSSETNRLRYQFRLRGCSADVYIFAIICPVLIYMVVLWNEGGVAAVRQLKPIDYIGLMAKNILLVPLWEELGWRGFLYRSLSRQMDVKRAMLLVGLIWATWHLPLYCLVWHASTLSYAVSFATILGMSFLLSLLYSVSGESVVVPTIFHASWNSAGNVVVRLQPNYHLGTVLIELAAIWLAVWFVWWSFRDDIKWPLRNDPQRHRD